MDSILEGQNVSGRIRAIMATRNLKKADLAVLLGVTVETIGNRLASDNWDYKDLRAIADKYKIDLSDLVS